VNLKNYIPNPEEISQQEKLLAYRKLRDWMTEAAPELDASPGSVFGDLAVNPASLMLAAQEQGWNRVVSDLFLDNPAKGLVYNCDFLIEYLDNFTAGTAPARSMGMVRLVSTTGQHAEIDKGITLSDGNNSFQFATNYPGDVRILPTGSKLTPGTNNHTWYQTSENRYFVDLMVYGEPEATVRNNASFGTEGFPSHIVSIVAIHDFYTPVIGGVIEEHVARARNSYLAVSWNTRASSSRSLRYYFPELNYASSVITGDPEMKRAVMSPLGLPKPCLDLYMGSSLYGSTFRQVFRAEYEEDTDSFCGKLVLAHTPLRIRQISLPNSPLHIPFESYMWTDSDTTPALTSAFGSTPEYWVTFKMPRDPASGSPQIPVSVDPQGRKFQNLEVVYYADAVFDSIDQFFRTKDNSPMGVSLYSRMPYPVIIESLRVLYKKKKGYLFDRDFAEENVRYLFDNFSSDNPYNETDIGKVLQEAGAMSLDRIEANASLWMAPTSRLIVEEPELTPTRTILLSGSVPVPQFMVPSSSVMLGEFIENPEETGPEGPLGYGASTRNMAYIVNNIEFRETT
jgi:hypothetical protein